MISKNGFIQDYTPSLTRACELANKRFPDIPEDEWSINILCHTEGEPQITLFHTENDDMIIEIITPVNDNKTMLINDGIMELI